MTVIDDTYTNASTTVPPATLDALSGDGTTQLHCGACN
jgi:hypothetical protein